jgi:transcriptional regulator with XRE-family HTH domain
MNHEGENLMSSDEETRKAQGRKKLRDLRRIAGKTQEQIEQEAGLAVRTLTRIERGKAGRENPEKATLEAILRAIGARYNDRRDVLSLFNYNTSTPLPDEDEITQARQDCHDDLHNVSFPAYILDCAQRAVDWNRCVPPLIDAYVQDMEQLRGLYLTDILFGEPYQLANMVKNRDELFPTLLRVFHHTAQPFADESWYKEYMTHTMNDLPLFRKYWDMTHQQGTGNTPARLRIIAILEHRDVGELRFGTQVEPLSTDSRFRIVYFMPRDQKTESQCATWADQ